MQTDTTDRRETCRNEAGSGGEQRQKVGLLVEGGGMKCAYSAGVLDAFLDEGIAFDYCAGVSAGAANLGSFT